MLVFESLEHLQFVVDHLLIALDVPFQDDLDSHLTKGAVSLTHGTIGSGTQSPAEFVFRPRRKKNKRVSGRDSWFACIGRSGLLLIIALWLAMKAIEHP